MAIATSVIRTLSACLLLLAGLVTAQQIVQQSVTIYAWPLTASKPQELAQITYGGSNAASQASISRYNAPKSPSGAEPVQDLVRIGLYDPITKDWHGIVTSAQNFDLNYQQKISLHLDLDHNPWHVGFSSYPKPSTTQKVLRKGQEREVVPQAVAEVILPTPAPTPHLNRPVVLSPDGKVETEEKDQKTFLQK